jgi:hypothetical protein
MNSRSLIDAVTEVLSEDSRVVFAYLYGSFAELQEGNDIDVPKRVKRSQKICLTPASLEPTESTEKSEGQGNSHKAQGTRHGVGATSWSRSIA